MILTALRCILKISKFWVWEIFAKNDKKCRKITNFQFWISRPIWPTLMICKLDKVSIRFFVTNPRYQANIPRIRQKIAFFEVRYHFGPFSHKPKNQFFAEYSTGVEISTVKFSEKKLMMFVDIHNKYLELTLITYENIQKVNRNIFLQPHSSVYNFDAFHQAKLRYWAEILSQWNQ